MLAKGLPDICISHRSTWGIPLDLPSFEGQVIYVWFEMAAGYIAADIAADAERKRGCPFFSDKGANIVHFYGFDNAYYHTLLFPAIYVALSYHIETIRTHVINELLFLSGEKFSTSRRHLIWANRLLEYVPTDYVRWGLARIRPEARNENFSVEEFLLNTNTFFADSLKEWLQCSVNCLTERYQKIVPEPGLWSQEHIIFNQEISNWEKYIERGFCVDGFSTQKVVRGLEEIVKHSRQFFYTQCLYESSSATRDLNRTTVALNFRAIAIFARLASPIMPTIGSQLFDALKIDDLEKIDGVSGFINHAKEIRWTDFPELPCVSPDLAGKIVCVN